MKGSRRSASPRMPRHRGRLRPLLAALPLALVALGAPWAAHLTAQTAPVTQRASEADFREESGVLGDGTEWIIRVPANWNGVLLRDLDVAGWARETPLTYYLLSAGGDKNLAVALELIREREDEIRRAWHQHFGR